VKDQHASNHQEEEKADESIDDWEKRAKTASIFEESNFLDRNRKSDNELQKLEEEVYQKDRPISFSNASSQPRAMVVKSCNAVVTLFAVFTAQWLL